MIPQKYESQLFSLILSGLMSLLVSGISTFHAIGLASNLADIWLTAWLAAWLFAYPAVMLVNPITRKAVQFLTARD